ncbi:hypothetical protein VE01_04901 [Pseudogymnoascus verrucosus]|uniref:Uncharacterized protein n=1 Tax=Pseudogymnoascus verrucosus TaxID=342668 RepID=A0A1B8GMN7_9PEZI|nr:uncharacterized protein VE01_04901 [Pseudogymnoascus verrucosus]OBT97102.1 hypothetical protein VE01_04901 [Pseudogymnoascus verrucosus]
MEGESKPKTAVAQQPRQQSLAETKNSLRNLVIMLRGIAYKHKQLLQQESALQRDCAPQLVANLHQAIELLGGRPVPKDLERIQGLLRGAERLRAVMGQRRAEMERESGQLDVYISALKKAAFFITGYDTSSGTVAGSGGALSG